MQPEREPDERAHDRKRISVFVEVESAGERRSGYLQELSLRGFFLRCRPPLRAGATCSVRLLVGPPIARPNGAPAQRAVLQLAGRIARSSLLGNAVEFEAPLAPGELAQLSELLERSA